MLKAALVLLGAIITTGLLYGQAPPAEHVPGGIQAGASYSFLHLDYSVINPSAFTAFSDYELTSHFGAEGEFRTSFSTISESNYLIGPRAVYPYRGFNPYVKFLAGLGRFHAPGAVGQNGSFGMISYGVGVDYTVDRRITFRLIDYEYQKWLNFPPRGLQPNVVTVGVAFRIK